MTEAERTTTEPAAAPALSGPQYDGPRSTIVPLAYPFSLDGIRYSEVTVRRITGREAQAYSRALRDFLSGEGDEPQFPGIVLPPAAFDALDDDDLAALDTAADAFFPARFEPLKALASQLAGAPTVTGGAI